MRTESRLRCVFAIKWAAVLFWKNKNLQMLLLFLYITEKTLCWSEGYSLAITTSDVLPQLSQWFLVCDILLCSNSKTVPCIHLSIRWLGTMTKCLTLSPTHPILSPSASKSGDLCGGMPRTALSSPVSSSSKSDVLRKSKLSRALSTVRLRLDDRLLWPGRRHCRGKIVGQWSFTLIYSDYIY